MEADIERADGNRVCGVDGGQDGGELSRHPHTPALQPDEDKALDTMVAFDDLVSDACDRSPHIVGAEDGAGLDAH